ncbi:MAG: DUF1761 domain-containing protein [Chloroflexi bacterium]|nr:DUF1761 domain-containing protein [Chloroflexota bacterium]
MPELNPLAVIVAAAVVFVVSSAYYIVFAARVVDLRGDGTESDGMQPWKIGIEVVRCLVLASVVAGVVAAIGVTDAVEALQLAIVLWIGFPVILLVGSVIWENVPGALAAIHAGDWLLKLLIVAMVVTVWR